MRRTIVYMLIAILAVAGAVLFYSHVIKPRMYLRVAVGGDGGASQRFMAALAPLLATERSRLRFRYVTFADPADAARAMERGEIDLMIGRSDLAPAPRGQTIVIMRRDAVALIVPPKSNIENFAGLAGKTVILPVGNMQQHNETVLDMVLDYYSVPRSSVSRLFMSASDSGRAIRDKRAAAVFAIGPFNSAYIPESVASIRRVLKESPSILEVAESNALVAKLPRFEAVEMPRGAVSGNPPVPDEAVDTIALPVRLLAANTMSAQLASDIARVITTRKATLVEMVPGASQIEAPDTEDKSTVLPVHPGALAYFSGEQESLFDRVENFIYYGALLLSLLGSIAAWLMGRVRKSRHGSDDVRKRVDGLLALVARADDANSEERARMLAEVESQADWALQRYAEGEIDAERYAMIEAVLKRARVKLGLSPLVRQKLAAE